MTTLHLIRGRLQTDQLARWAADRSWIDSPRGGFFDEGRALHHLLTETLGPGAIRSFRLLVPPRRTTGNLYAYSRMDAAELKTAARIHGLPETFPVLAFDQLESKKMPGDWGEGQRLGFDLRIWPTQRMLRDANTSGGRFSKGSEVDAFLLEALRRHPTVPDGMVAEQRTREAVYLDWLAKRFDGAAILDRSASRLVRFRRIRVARGKRGLEGPDATVHGTMTIADPIAFSELLTRGVGRHRGYGYGMLLLRPPGRPVPDR